MAFPVLAVPPLFQTSSVRYSSTYIFVPLSAPRTCRSRSSCQLVQEPVTQKTQRRRSSPLSILGLQHGGRPPISKLSISPPLPPSADLVSYDTTLPPHLLGALDYVSQLLSKKFL